jgi:hypothetical protein
MGKIILDLNKTYTYADYLKWSFDETIELINGFVVKMAQAPGLTHQIISIKLTIKMGLYFENKIASFLVHPLMLDYPKKSTKLRMLK